MGKRKFLIDLIKSQFSNYKNMTEEVEKLLQDTIFPDLENGRPNWDKPHTQAVIHRLKLILSSVKYLYLDESVLLIAAYAHDWGYAGLYKEGESLAGGIGKNEKEKHPKISAEKLEKLFKNKAFDYLSVERKERATHLVLVHDLLDNIKGNDERVLVEADTLGGLDIDFVKPTFNSEANAKWMGGVRNKRIPLFLTEYGKREVERLLRMREEYYKNKED